MFKNILVPTDGSELSGEAIREAVRFAKSLGARITGFYAAPEYPVQVYGDYIPPDLLSPTEFDALNKKHAARFLGAIEKAAGQAGVQCECFSALSSQPHAAIIKAAQQKKCDLIFMASHGRRGIAGLLLGSETQKVLAHSKIPVLVHR